MGKWQFLGALTFGEAEAGTGHAIQAVTPGRSCVNSGFERESTAHESCVFEFEFMAQRRAIGQGKGGFDL